MLLGPGIINIANLFANLCRNTWFLARRLPINRAPTLVPLESVDMGLQWLDLLSPAASGNCCSSLGRQPCFLVGDRGLALRQGSLPAMSPATACSWRSRVLLSLSSPSALLAGGMLAGRSAARFCSRLALSLQFVSCHSLLKSDIGRRRFPGATLRSANLDRRLTFRLPT